MLKQWDELPDFMKIPEVRPYWEKLYRKRFQLFWKRFFDLATALVLLILLALPMAIIALAVKLDSKGGVFYRQKRVTTYGRHFYIHKFRTMVQNADQIGAAVTAQGDARVTRIGKFLRRSKLDELPQLFDVIAGDMSFVGTRPEVPKYVEHYLPAYYATLLLPAGITSEASVRFKNEEELLTGAEDIDKAYEERVLPEKMEINLESIGNFRLTGELRTMFRTVAAVLGKDYR